MPFSSRVRRSAAPNEPISSEYSVLSPFFSSGLPEPLPQCTLRCVRTTLNRVSSLPVDQELPPLLDPFRLIAPKCLIPVRKRRRRVIHPLPQRRSAVDDVDGPARPRLVLVVE